MRIMKRFYLTAAACFIAGNIFAQTTGTDSSFIETKNDSLNEIIKPTAELFPNPAKNKISLELAGFDPGMINIKIIDLSGNEMRKETRMLINGNEEVIMFFFLPRGIYFIIMQQNEKAVKKKLLVS